MSQHMSNIESRGRQQADFIDLDQIVREWAWQQFYQVRRSKEEKLMGYDDVNIYPDYTDVTVSHGRPVYSNQQHSRLPKTSNLFRTSFHNNTEEAQEYTVTASRTTRSSCEVEVGRSFTMGGEVSVKVAVPGSIVEANAGFRSELALQKTNRSTEENELTWGIDSTIKVQPMHRATASIEVIEEKLGTDFEIVTTLSGRVRATITDPRRNNCFLLACAGNVNRVFQRLEKTSDQKAFLDDDVLNIVSSGKLNFRFGVEQVVHVDQSSL